MVRRACWATVHGVAKSQTQLNTGEHTHETEMDLGTEGTDWRSPRRRGQCRDGVGGWVQQMLLL